MRVVHLIKATGIAGAERHLLILCAALRQAGVDAQLLVLVSPDKPVEDLARAAAAEGIPFSRLLIRRSVDFRLMPLLVGKLRQLRPDILHTHLIHADLQGVIAGRLAGVKTIISSRHNDNAFRRKPLFRALNRVMWRGFTAGIAISEQVAQFCRTVEAAPRHRLHVIHYGYNPPVLTDFAVHEARAALRSRLRLPADTPLVVMACRLTEQKGVAYALEAMPDLLVHVPAVHLVIAGDGALRSSLEARSRQLGVAASVHFLGWQSNVPVLLAGADVFLMPSLWEGFGLVLLEAMAARLPVVASDVSAIPEVVADGETGILVPPQDAPAIAAALLTLLDDATLRQQMGAAGMERVLEHFSVARMLQDTLSVYRMYHA